MNGKISLLGQVHWTYYYIIITPPELPDEDTK